MRYTNEEIKEAVSSSLSYNEVIKKLYLKASGGRYKSIKRRINNLKLNTNHFLGRQILKGKTHTWSKSIPLSKILVKHSNYQSYKLKLRLIKEGYFEAKCYKCGITEWQGQPAPLELEHKNGIKTDNRLENLTILCANCHAQTDTYRAKNKGKNGKNRGLAEGVRIPIPTI